MLGMEVFGGLALDEHGVGTNVQNGAHGQDIGLAEMLEGVDKGGIAGEALVPPTVLRRECGGDEYLVDRSEILDPGITDRKGARVFGKKRRPFRVLEVADPVRHAEMA